MLLLFLVVPVCIIHFLLLWHITIEYTENKRDSLVEMLIFCSISTLFPEYTRIISCILVPLPLSNNAISENTEF
jgi:NADH:ubiquinone oxidoreductase subunit 3 (subunit A)